MNLQQFLQNLPELNRRKTTLTFQDNTSTIGWLVIADGKTLPWAVFKEKTAEHQSYYCLATGAGLQDRRLKIKSTKNAMFAVAYLCHDFDWDNFEVVTIKGFDFMRIGQDRLKIVIQRCNELNEHFGNRW